VCASPHKLASGISADILGANETEYNGAFVVTVVDELSFTYEIVGSPTTPATGTISVDFDGALLSVETEGTGLDQNVGAGAGVNFVSPPAGLDGSAFAGPNGIEGGTDIEADEELRSRVLEKRATIESLFNPAAITTTARAVSGVTRVFIKEITPEIGAVTIYFMRDGDENPIPSTIDIQNVNDQIQAIRPGHTAESDVIVLAPTPVVVDITLSGIAPDTTTMRANIEASLADYFTTFIDFEQDVLIDRIKTALFQAQDVETGEFLTDFTLDDPAADVTINTSEIAVLGMVTIS